MSIKREEPQRVNLIDNLILTLRNCKSYKTCLASTFVLLGCFVFLQPMSHAADAGAGRNFYEVMEDVMADFEYDIKTGQVQGLKDLSIRNIALSEGVPASFKTHLELNITERIMKNSKTRMVQCLPCRAKRTTVNGDQVFITSPETNPQELSRIAKISNISNFMDVAFSYQPTGMVLSFTIIEPEAGAIVWSRSYNSEVSRASAIRRGVDFAQVDDARKQAEYHPTIQHRLTAYYLYEKNIGTNSGCLALGYRMVERYDNRLKEVGFEVNYLRDASTLIAPAKTEPNLYKTVNLTLLFVHSWNFIGNEENFNLVRGNLFTAVGGTYATGFLGGLFRAGWEWRLARHSGVSVTLGYRPKSTAFFNSEDVGPVSGLEAGMGISYLF